MRLRQDEQVRLASAWAAAVRGSGAAAADVDAGVDVDVDVKTAVDVAEAVGAVVVGGSTTSPGSDQASALLPAPRDPPRTTTTPGQCRPIMSSGVAVREAASRAGAPVGRPPRRWRW